MAQRRREAAAGTASAPRLSALLLAGWCLQAEQRRTEIGCALRDSRFKAAGLVSLSNSDFQCFIIAQLVRGCYPRGRELPNNMVVLSYTLFHEEAERRENSVAQIISGKMMIFSHCRALVKG